MPASARRRWAVAVASSVVILATGCAATDGVCPAIGYLSTLEVRVVGAVAYVDDIVPCVDDACTPEGAASELGIVTSPPVRGDDTWSFTGEFPEQMTVRALDAAGEVLADQEVDVTWTRTGGSEECGGPTFGSLTLEI
ncbi:hypothetical protein [Microbacterium sp.]|uniref:hypothetical protein n=1 Tax=Microbacterium sp. TaxID=51671 RepID=UPI0037351EF8